MPRTVADFYQKMSDRVRTDPRRGMIGRGFQGWVRTMRCFVLVLMTLFVLGFAPAEAGVTVHIDKSSQRMTVAVDGRPTYAWPVSTGRRPYITPNGRFRPQMMMRSYFSRKYYGSPMPYSIFFHYGYAIHGTNAISRLGGPASHGCVRLHPSNAATLFALVQRAGAANTDIIVSGY